MTAIAKTNSNRAHDDYLDQPIWGAKNIGVEINKKPAATFHLLASGKLDADKVGDQWVTTRRRLRRQFGGAASAAMSIPEHPNTAKSDTEIELLA
jgi:hypothetical protein